mmetsp:Transcript_1837/g.4959  ORF Transcript_1837/g.4959 Transcript_1837/m.4959 type:complete len:304 (-) Transcript_1837:80-991(-)
MKVMMQMSKSKKDSYRKPSIFGPELTASVDPLVKQYMTLFEIDQKGGLLRSPSFAVNPVTAETSKPVPEIIRRCREISQIWYIVFSEGLKGQMHEEYQFVNILHVTAFGEIMRFWRRRRDECRLAEKGRREWWDVPLEVSKKEELNLTQFMRVLVPPKAQTNHVSDALSDEESEVKPATMSPTSKKTFTAQDMVVKTFLGKKKTDAILIDRPLAEAVESIKSILESMGVKKLNHKAGDSKLKFDYSADNVTLTLSTNFQPEKKMRTVAQFKKAQTTKSSKAEIHVFTEMINSIITRYVGQHSN